MYKGVLYYLLPIAICMCLRLTGMAHNPTPPDSIEIDGITFHRDKLDGIDEAGIRSIFLKADDPPGNSPHRVGKMVITSRRGWVLDTLGGKPRLVKRRLLEKQRMDRNEGNDTNDTPFILSADSIAGCADIDDVRELIARRDPSMTDPMWIMDGYVIPDSLVDGISPGSIAEITLLEPERSITLDNLSRRRALIVKLKEEYEVDVRALTGYEREKQPRSRKREKKAGE